MKKILLLCVSILLVTIITGCATQKKRKAELDSIMNSWTGYHISAVIQKWGPETKITGDGKGGNIYTWEKTWQTNAYYDYNKVYQPPQNRYCNKNFYVNKEGIVYAWRYDGYCY